MPAAKNPDPKVFAKTVLSELSRLRAETIVLKLRLYQHMTATPGWGQTLAEMDNEDKPRIEQYRRELLNQNLIACGLTPDPTPPDIDR